MKLFGHPDDEVAGLRVQGRPGARHRRHPGHVRARLHGGPPAHRVAGHRPRRTAGAACERRTWSLLIGTVVALTAYLTRLYGPLTALSNVQVDVMTALVSFDRVFEVLDLPPMIDEKPDAVAIPRGPAPIEFDHVDFSYPDGRGGVAGLARVGGRARPGTVAVRCCSTSRSGPSPGSWWPWWARRVRARRPSATWSPASTTCGAGRCASTASTSATPRSTSIHDIVGVVTQDAHLFHETIRANLLYAKPDATDDELIEALRAAQILPLVRLAPRRARHPGRRPRLPAVGRREAADRHRPAAAQGARHRRPRRGHRPSRLRVGAGRPAGPQDGPRRAHVARHRPPALHRARGGPDPRGRRRAHRRARAPTPSCSPRAACTPSSTGRSSPDRPRPPPPTEPGLGWAGRSAELGPGPVRGTTSAEATLRLSPCTTEHDTQTRPETGDRTKPVAPVTADPGT